MGYTNYQKGSEWRKWDLHIHTKDTNKNDQFKSKDFDSFCITLFKKALGNDIKAIGVTDYFSITNYNKVINFISNIESCNDFSKEQKCKIKEIFILPDVELRMLPVTDKAKLVNIHCLFNPEFVETIENDFFSSIEYSAGSGKKFKMNYQGMIDLGKYLDDNLDSEGAYKRGIDNFVVSHESLQKLLDENKKFRENVLIVVSNSNKDGASALQKHYDLFEKEKGSLDAVRKSIYNLSSAIFSANRNDRDYFLGKKSDDEETVIDKCGSLKPCIHGSDAHTEDKLFKPDNNNYCWIKADLTFNGLKQIIYEPESRVAVQEEKPEDKKQYSVINAVRFIDKRSRKEFPEDWIYLNTNLNSIIGGKSSGKSLLLYHIAKTIDPDRIKEIQEYPEFKNFGYPYEDSSKFDFEVQWADDEMYKFREEKEKNRAITYIPQLYLNTLAEHRKNELNELVEKMLKENYEEYKSFLSKVNSKIQHLETKIRNEINKYTQNKNQLIEKEKELKELGDEKAVQDNIKKITNKLSNLKKDSELTQKQENDYDTFLAKKEELKKQLNEVEDLTKIVKFTEEKLLEIKESIAEDIEFGIKEKIEFEFSDINIINSKKIVNALEHISNAVKNTLENEIKKKIIKLLPSKQVITKIKQDIKNLDKKIIPIEKKIKSKDIYQKELKLKEVESKKLQSIQRKKSEISNLQKNISLKKIEDYYKDLFETFNKILKENEKYKIIKGAKALELSSSLKFDIKRFRENFSQKIDKRKTLKSLFDNLFSDDGKFLFNKTTHCKNITFIADKLSKKVSSIRTEFTEENVLLSLFDTYFIIDYDLIQDGDSLLQMSPGEMGIVLFQLFLHLSKSENPILIDQPEDNLDNRTVYQELNDFIREKKIQRQIIIVSHNANLVVSTDSENIIVANQHGQNKSAKNKKYKFEYVNGSIEYSFLKENEKGILFQKGIRQHVCDILEGGDEAFIKREKKYGF